MTTEGRRNATAPWRSQINCQEIIAFAGQRAKPERCGLFRHRPHRLPLAVINRQHFLTRIQRPLPFALQVMRIIAAHWHRANNRARR